MRLRRRSSLRSSSGGRTKHNSFPTRGLAMRARETASAGTPTKTDGFASVAMAAVFVPTDCDPAMLCAEHTGMPFRRRSPRARAIPICLGSFFSRRLEMAERELRRRVRCAIVHVGPCEFSGSSGPRTIPLLWGLDFAMLLFRQWNLSTGLRHYGISA